VLFADLVGSTALAHDEDPERVRALLARFYEAMSAEIERTGGTVEKFAGDGVMAAFGAPAALEDHAERALHAGLAMQRRLRDIFEGELAMRVGVNTGEVVVGSAHEGGSFLTGDAVNVGARLEQGAAPGEVLAGERTVAAARGAFEFGDARLLEAKGKPDGVVAHPVVRALTIARPRGLAAFRRVFVGRDPEVDLLLATVRRAFGQHEPHLVTIVGEPGVGKTTLVQELWERLSAEDPKRVRRTGRCLPYGDGITYWPLGEVLKEHFGLVEGSPAGSALEHLEGQDILGLALGGHAATGLHPLEAREQLHAAAVAFLETLARERPAVVIFEDIHWAEDDFLDLLERIEREARAPVAVLATTRPELLARRQTWGGGRRNATTIWLEPLHIEDAARMVDELLDVQLPADLRRLLVERSEGNPFFVEELLGGLVDAGVVERTDDGWVTRELPAGFSVPDSVFAVLAARMDRLPPLEKAALQAASVIGRAFWAGPVIHLLDGESPDLELLEERDFVRRQSGSTIGREREYAIKHALTREVAYASIPKARRGLLHASLAAWLEGDEASRDQRASLLAYHYAEAVRPEDADLVWGNAPEELTRVRSRAVHWLSRAAELARGRSEFDESIELLSGAVELCGDDHERALLWREIGRSNALRFDGDAFWSAMERALDGPLDDAERADAYSVLAFETSNRSGMWGIQTVPELVDAWADRALELAAPDSDARVRALIARTNMEPSRHTADADLAGVLAEQSGDLVLRSFALQVRTSAAQDAGRYEEAESLAEQRLELVPEIDDPDHLLDVYESSAPALAMVGRLDEARDLAAMHERDGEALTPHHRVHSFALFCEIEDAAGGWEAIAARSDEIVAAVEGNLETPCTRNARSLLLAAVALLATGTESRALEKRALHLAQRGWSAGGLASPGIRLGLLRRDRAEIERWLDLDVFRMHVYGPGVMTARLDALAAMRDRDQVEVVATAYLEHGQFLEPFALRALGIVIGDAGQLEHADRLFAERGLDWHRSQTEPLLAGL
jgi:class 3 adenylate cyclase